MKVIFPLQPFVVLSVFELLHCISLCPALLLKLGTWDKIQKRSALHYDPSAFVQVQEAKIHTKRAESIQWVSSSHTYIPIESFLTKSKIEYEEELTIIIKDKQWHIIRFTSLFEFESAETKAEKDRDDSILRFEQRSGVRGSVEACEDKRAANDEDHSRGQAVRLWLTCSHWCWGFGLMLRDREVSKARALCMLGIPQNLVLRIWEPGDFPGFQGTRICTFALHHFNQKDQIYNSGLWLGLFSQSQP